MIVITLYDKKHIEMLMKIQITKCRVWLYFSSYSDEKNRDMHARSHSSMKFLLKRLRFIIWFFSGSKYDTIQDWNGVRNVRPCTVSRMIKEKTR